MTDQAMSPLRRRMIEDMTIRKFAPKTQHDYLQRVKNFTIHLGRSPDTASSEDVLRTPAPGVCRATITGPASANLHICCHRQSATPSSVNHPKAEITVSLIAART